MTIIVDLLIIGICAAGLWFGAGWVVEAASRIARRFGLSELVIGLTIVAMGTSAPEFAVTFAAALGGRTDISVGNVVGSNIFNLGFILGGVALVRAVSTSRTLVVRDGAMLIGTTALLLIMLNDLTLTRWEGLLMMALLVGYVLMLLRNGDAPEEEIPEGEFTWTDVPRLVAGIAIIVTGGHFLVDAATELARTVGISEWVIGVTIVAAGTSAPELATSLVAVIRDRHGISIGNLIGSDIFNLLGVLGLAAALRTMSVDPSAFQSVIVLVGMVILVVVMMRSGWRLSRAEGGILVGLNAFRWIADFGF